VACIVLALEYIHSNKFLHRDIKPENLVLDEKGYLRITDFGVAKISQKENSSETSGTPGYMAPEVMCAQNHTCAVDYFALGVITYEFMLGVRPYLGKSRKEIKDMILAKQVQVKPAEKPADWSVDAVSFINAVCISVYLAFTKKALSAIRL
jgi:serine/threonine protein kinase